MRSLLIVEDDPIVRKIYQSKFVNEGFTVRVAVDGQEAVEALKASRPDIVLLDLMLPKVDGLDVLKLVRSQPSTSTVPVIVFSNAYANQLIQEAWDAGATKCLTKVDCTPRQVIEVIHKALEEAASPPKPAPVAAAPVPPPPDLTELESASGAPAADMPAAPARPKRAAAPVAAPAAIVPANPAPQMTPAQMLESEIAFQEELKRSFLKSAPELLNGIRSMFQGFVKAEVEAKQQMLADLVTSLRSLTSNAAVSGCQRFAQMASAVEALVRELYEKPKNINQSTIRTIALALHTLQTLVPAEEEPPPPDAMAPVVLVVDDEVISRRTVAQALQKARLRAITVDAPGDALKLVQENKFDLIFLDVDMPGMNGFDLCAKIRAVPTNKATPVVFVTNLNDFNHRTKSAQSGGNDLIGKPFMLIELAVKALTYLMQLPPAKPIAPKPA